MPVKQGREGMKSCMKEFGAGKLHSGGDGKVVTDRKQALAICLRSSGMSRQTPPKGKR